MAATNNVITALNGVREISRSIADKDIRDKFLRDFSPTFNELMKNKKYLYISCESRCGNRTQTVPD